MSGSDPFLSVQDQKQEMSGSDPRMPGSDPHVVADEGGRRVQVPPESKEPDTLGSDPHSGRHEGEGGSRSGGSRYRRKPVNRIYMKIEP